MSSYCCCYSSSNFLPPPFLNLNPKPKPKPRPLLPLPIRSSAAITVVSDPFVVEIAEKLEDSLSLSTHHSSPSPPLQKLRDVSSVSLLSKSWPSNKDESFRFTDTSFLKSVSLSPAPYPNSLLNHHADATSSLLLTVLDGHVITSLSRLSSLPPSVFVGSARDLPQSHKALAALGLGFGDSNPGDLFSDLNGVGPPDVAVVYVPTGVRVSEPIHLRFCYGDGGDGVEEGRLPLSSPRVLVLVEKGAEVGIVEEHFGLGGDAARYWANSVMEIVVEEGGKLRHSYLQSQSTESAHTKWTCTLQEAFSNYELTEISTGGRLSRHNLHIQQLGPNTVTELSAFHVSRSNQIQDLHSKLVLDHPRGFSRQLHKCIVSSPSGHAVFDGNVKVNRFAQQTDAGQLTRTLLLENKATANVKPNLQIIADDVKCSHGATISDLEEDQLFYFKARGVDHQTARDALVFSFGAEVLDRIPFELFRKSVSRQVQQVLAANE